MIMPVLSIECRVILGLIKNLTDKEMHRQLTIIIYIYFRYNF